MQIDLKKLTLQQTAALLCLTSRQINNLVNRGIFPKHGSRKTAHYVWSEVFDGYLADRCAELEGRNGKQDASNLAEAELRRTNADARLKELKADEMEGKLVDVPYAERVQGQINANVRARLLAMPSKLTPQLVGVMNPGKVKAIVERETNQVCEELVKIAGKSPRPRKVEEEDEELEHANA